MSQPIVFALARFRGFFDAQAYTVLVVEPDALRLVKGEGEPDRFAFKDLEKAEFVHSRSASPGWMESIGGFFTRPKEDMFRFRAGEQSYEVALEIDSHHRKREVITALTWMYQAGVKVTERVGTGKATFLLEKKTVAEIEAGIKELMGE